MGRSKLSDKVREIRGTDRKDRKSSVVLLSVSKLPAPPKSFSKTAKNIYKTIGPSVLITGILTPINLTQFISYCNWTALYLDTDEKIKDQTTDDFDPRIEKDSKGRTHISGIQKLLNEAYENSMKAAKEFGFTPATVNKIGISIKKDDADQFAKFLNS